MREYSTEQQRLAKNGQCPECGSDQVDGGTFQAQGDTLVLSCVCFECEKEWDEFYVWDHAEPIQEVD
jgi:transcription elongation factor Elf1